MNKTKLKAPTKAEKRVMRLLIVFGLLSIINFFYWFLKDDLIAHPLLYAMLLSLIMFDVFRVIYIWYHYWSISVPKKPKVFKDHTVDVFTTFYPGEPEEMVINTLLAIKNINYPHNTYLCDEANNPRLKTFCDEHDIIHVTRTNRNDAKAGNINNALEIASGEICLILDPDHIPHPDFLDEVIPYFNDKKVGFVQTVQSYYNKNDSKVAQAAAEQTFQFYGPVMMSMNSYGTVNAIGANCVFRRKALDSIDGHAAGLSEDMHTAMKLHAKGWKSVYLPKALSEGLAPNTLTAYYKQQLKWSRGTFDLLFSAYPKLFQSFSLKQKLHYGILPFHYLAGFIFMMSFLIPIISLFFSIMPWKGNVVNFGLIILPVLVSLITIRFYSQKWLIREEERGFHILGGLLLQCTWWVYINGVVYTLIKKKVPYIPTLKNDDDSPNIILVFPNIIFGLLCIISVVYGLYRDFTPFSIVMSFFALWNAAILFYTLRFAYGNGINKSVNNKRPAKTRDVPRFISLSAFGFSNKLALPIILVALIGSIALLFRAEKLKQQGYIPKPEVVEKFKYLGVFAPENDDGISTFNNVAAISEKLNQKFDLISFYIPWNKDIDSSFNWSILDSVYEGQAIPLITWEPWLNTFENDLDSIPHVNDLILTGYLDNYLNEFAQKLKKINKPIFLRYSHEFDNPFYPWYDKRPTASTTFKEAWRYVHSVFREKEANNVIWIWNPWEAEDIQNYYPGDGYVDWLGANILNYSMYGKKDYYKFSELYESFHYKFKRIASKPVIIAEFGTLTDGIYQQRWLDDALQSMKNRFKEIDALVYFHSDLDDNHPIDQIQNDDLNWTVFADNWDAIKFKGAEVPNYVFNDLDRNNKLLKINDNRNSKLNKVIGVNLVKGDKWNEDYHILARKDLVSDFENMTKIGINGISFIDKGIYNYNLLSLSKEYGFKLNFGFDIPINLDFLNNDLALLRLKNQILEVIEKYKGESHIMSWYIQNDVLTNLDKNYNKPALFYQQQGYLKWLNDLVKDIKSIDSRPIIINIETNRNSVQHSKSILTSIKEDITIGLIAEEVEIINEVENFLSEINSDYIFSEIDVNTIDTLNLIQKNIPFYITEWQDQHRVNHISYEGLIDREGRKKVDYFKLENLTNKNNDDELFKIKVIKPLRGLVGGFSEEYFAMIYNEKGQWEYADEKYMVEWSLVKHDGYGNHISVQKVGDKPVLELTIPTNYTTYHLELSVTKADVTEKYITTLNTPYTTN